MTLTIELKPEVEKLLKQKASAKGCAVDDYVEDLIEKDVNKQKTLQLFVSEETLTELRDVLERPSIKDRFKLSTETIEEYIKTLRKISKVLNEVPKVFSLPRDVD